jgi:hypothetical protein
MKQYRIMQFYSHTIPSALRCVSESKKRLDCFISANMYILAEGNYSVYYFCSSLHLINMYVDTHAAIGKMNEALVIRVITQTSRLMADNPAAIKHAQFVLQANALCSA